MISKFFTLRDRTYLQFITESTFSGESRSTSIVRRWLRSASLRYATSVFSVNSYKLLLIFSCHSKFSTKFLSILRF